MFLKNHPHFTCGLGTAKKNIFHDFILVLCRRDSWIIHISMQSLILLSLTVWKVSWGWTWRNYKNSGMGRHVPDIHIAYLTYFSSNLIVPCNYFIVCTLQMILMRYSDYINSYTNNFPTIRLQTGNGMTP